MEEDDPSDEYVRAYNIGYQMAKHEPALYKQVLNSPNEPVQREYLKALSHGGDQFEKEILIQEMKNQRSKNLSKKPKRH